MGNATSREVDNETMTSVNSRFAERRSYQGRHLAIGIPNNTKKSRALRRNVFRSKQRSNTKFAPRPTFSALTNFS